VICIQPDILLIQCPVWGINMPPMSLASISRYLRVNDIATKILDLNIEEYHRAKDKGYWINEKAHFWMEKDRFEKLKPLLKFDFEKLARRIADEKPLALGFSISAASIFYSFELMKSVKFLDKDIKIILGGKGVWLPEEREYYKDYADFFVVGEGEDTILELMQGIKRGKSIEQLSEIKGLKSSKYPEKYAPRQLIDLEKLPFPTYEELDLSRYTEKTIGMRFSQGCIANCGFCEDKPFQGHHRTRDPVDVYNELRYHAYVNRIAHFWFHDLAINGNYEELEKLCNLIIGNNLKIKWICLAIARKDMPKELLFKMADAGCYTINFGIESGSNSVLKKMNKYEMFSAEDAERIMKWTREAGINVQPNFIVGYPGETEEEFQETLQFIKRNRDVITGITNINTCILPKRAPIGLASGRLGITSTDPVAWSDGTLTYEVRLDRAKRAYEFVKELGYDVYFSNLSQSGEDKKKNEPVDLALVVCPVWGVNTPPTGVNYLKEYMVSHGLNAEICDINLKLYRRHKDLQKYWHQDLKINWTEYPFFEELKKRFKVDLVEFAKELVQTSRVIGFSAYQENTLMIIELAKLIKNIDNNVKIVVGGPSCSVKRELERFRKSTIDYFVVGDGEEAIIELVDAIKAKKTYLEISGIPGIFIFRHEGKFKEREAFDLSKSKALKIDYNKDYIAQERIALYFSKGCIGECTFCNDVNIMGKFRVRPAEQVFQEIYYHVQKGITKFNFSDLLINGNIPELNKFCDLIISHKLKIGWVANAIPMKNLTQKLLEKMKRAGCDVLMFGVETGSDRILKAMKKYTTIETIEKVLKYSYEMGINAQPNFIVGYPGETEEDFQMTLDFIKRNRQYIDRICNAKTCNVVYNSELMENKDEYGIILPEDNSVAEVRWRTKDGTNTDSIRKGRLRRLLNLAKELNLEVYEDNLSAFAGYKEKEIVRKTDVFLIMCPPWDVLMPPLGIAYLASNLKKHGVKTEVFDMNIDLYNLAPENDKRAWHMEEYFKWSEEKFHEYLFQNYKPYMNNMIKRIMDDKPVLVGLSVNAANYNFSCMLAKILKKNNPELKICIGGPNSDDGYFWQSEMKDYIDFAVIGEAELMMPRIVQRLKENQPIEDLPGVVVLKANSSGELGPRKEKEKMHPWHFEKDLGELASPTFMEFNLKKYKENSLPMIASRGCVARCNFCLDWMYRANYTARPAKDVVDEMEMHIKNYGVNSFNFRDLVINGNLKALEEICNHIIKRNLEVNWSAQGIVNSRMSDQLLRKMRMAGCRVMVFGVESCSDTVLEKMNKPYRMKHLQDLLPRMHNAGITIGINLIIGYPGEGEKEFMETYDFVKSHAKYIKMISSLTPCLLIAGTNLTAEPEKAGIVVPNENDGFYKWHTSDLTNTYEIRKERVKRIAALCKELGVQTPLVNLYDEQAKKKPAEVKKKLKILS